ncbi:uncharacterized protein RAG0_05465 [Rhynchosporium agropyri]|uniref:Uncharacterized protein n=1 Tax=Rhynchosporium agropyri TaxID=914238 RepID=A0A1E1KDC8_9HELO|nr:uncharacterized protein RAG0_05465 [Rhynchosporium agropyri]
MSSLESGVWKKVKSQPMFREHKTKPLGTAQLRTLSPIETLEFGLESLSMVVERNETVRVRSRRDILPRGDEMKCYLRLRLNRPRRLCLVVSFLILSFDFDYRFRNSVSGIWWLQAFGFSGLRNLAARPGVEIKNRTR